MTPVGMLASWAWRWSSSTFLSLPPPLGSGTGRGTLLRLAVGSLPPGLSTACTNSSGLREGSSCVFSESRCTVRRMRDRLTLTLSSESLRNDTSTARTPAAYGDFFENFSLYLAASVHGLAVMVMPSWASREAVCRGGCCAAAAQATKSGTARQGILRAGFRKRL